MFPEWNPSSLNKRSWILGMGYGWRKIRFSSSLKSEIKRTVLSFFGIANFGAPHWDQLTFFITLIYSSRSSSCLNVSSCMCGTGKGFPWYGSAPCHVPWLPSNKYSYFFNSVYSSFIYWGSRWVEISAMILIMALEYLPSRMRFIIFFQSWKVRCAVITQTHRLLWNLYHAKGWRHSPS